MLSRRTFLQTSAACTASAFLARSTFADASAAHAKFTAAVIGHTGKGDYGHGQDTIFNGHADIEVVGVADPDPAGLAKAFNRTHAKRQYADYREMLEKEKPELVSIAMRWTDEHHPIAMAALNAGAHLITEKPFMQTLAQADEVLAMAAKRKLKVATAHQLRLAPSVQLLKKRIEDGSLIGELLQINAWGKQDARAGGEDMLVLGTHVFDLIRLFAGEARSCTARVLERGAPIKPNDARKPGEGIGLVIGDEIFAQFAFDNGINATFNSRQKLAADAGIWGLELIGSRAAARIVNNPQHPPIYIRKYEPWTDAGRNESWKRWDDDPSKGLTAEALGFDPANRRVLDNLLVAIREDREPACSGENAAKAIEMVHAVWRAGLTGERVILPLKERGHPLMLAADQRR